MPPPKFNMEKSQPTIRNIEHDASTTKPASGSSSISKKQRGTQKEKVSTFHRTKVATKNSAEENPNPIQQLKNEATGLEKFIFKYLIVELRL